MRFPVVMFGHSKKPRVAVVDVEMPPVRSPLESLPRKRMEMVYGCIETGAAIFAIVSLFCAVGFICAELSGLGGDDVDSVYLKNCVNAVGYGGNDTAHGLIMNFREGQQPNDQEVIFYCETESGDDLRVALRGARWKPGCHSRG
ncbi:b35.1 [miniopterid betaherpesvirus 1]|uniref:B35.1 n=1 Tax=miniopterid betaherpesvirus 1 TaxID=3070189 RepID=I3VQG9_9BETA|nr:b35.1 [miniopterid betaherpesvirus 1]AFK84013.1 b35.1 [miniopterid betaherpesvirus 1]